MAAYISTLLTEIEAELERQVQRLETPQTRAYHEMLTYHMGWTGEGAGPQAAGKRVRPLLVMLTYAATAPSAPIQVALPGAAAMELVHNFSLVHDDIQDNSELRRGRPTVWHKWGLAQGINAGNGLYALAELAILDLARDFPADTTIQAAQILNESCLNLTRGQFLDISYQDREQIGIEDYWPMVAGKTAALLSACCHLGALLGGADASRQDAYRSYGNYLGLAFQVQDDILGIWGDEVATGKSAVNDLVDGKKSLPVLVGLSKNGRFAERWGKGPIAKEEVPALAGLLASESAYEYTHDVAKQMIDLALDSLREAGPEGEAATALYELTDTLLKRSA